MKIPRSFGFAWSGLKYVFKTETNFRIHLILTLMTIGMGVGLHISTMEWLVILICFAIVLFAELINTALEKLCDIVQAAQHPGIKLVKDISAGAVLITAVISAVIGCVIFLPRIICLIKSL